MRCGGSGSRLRRGGDGAAFRGGCGGRAVSPEIARSLPPGEEKGWALVGGVGEYELVFAVPAGTSVADAVKIGRGGFTAQAACDFRIIYGGKVGRMVSPPPDYRAIPRRNWLAETTSYWTSLWAS